MTISGGQMMIPPKKEGQLYDAQCCMKEHDLHDIIVKEFI